MLDSVCSYCGRTATNVGPLCAEPCAWEPGRDLLSCKRCTAVNVMERESLRAIQEDAEMDAEHFDQCAWCHHRRGLMPKLALFQACAENRKAKEREALEEVAGAHV
jgi:hypothetical protein